MDLDTLYNSGLLNEIDRAFGELIHRISETRDPWVALAAGLVSRASAEGDACLDLAFVCEHGIQAAETDRKIPLGISLGQWRNILSSSSVVGNKNDNTPMILDGKRLYLQRYWNYEHQVADAIQNRCKPLTSETCQTVAKTIPAQLVGEGDPEQLQAVHKALNQRFTVITGGPGTGKTTTIARIILLLYHLESGKTLDIVLAAPTGKAAARMQDALDSTFKVLLRDDPVQLQVGRLKSQTLHRLLGALPGRTQYRYHQENPLPADVIIVDEASMIDLALMAKLMQAVSPSAKLILVGDKDQLASVEAGSVMGDICAGISDDNGSKKHHVSKSNAVAGKNLADHIVVLEKSYRFSAGSGIGQLASAIKAGEGRQALALLEDPEKRDIVFNSISGVPELKNALRQVVSDEIVPAFTMDEAHHRLRHFNTIRILSPVRKGPFGVAALNLMVENVLGRLGCIQRLPMREGQWYPGRPVMLKRNDYHRSLFNGDVGIAMADSGEPFPIRVAFIEAGGGIQWLTPEQLPAHETVYAMTVHKSQGTEFNKVVLVLPDRDVPLLTRELIYTAVTRARRHVEIWGDPHILIAAVERRIHRASGLRLALWP